MLEVLARSWAMLALRGVAALIFGVLTLRYPIVSLAVLVLMFGAFALVDGVFAAVAAIGRRRDSGQWLSLLISGLIGIGIGVVTLFWPGITAIALLYLIGFWALITGIGEIVAAIRLRDYLDREWLLIVAGVVSAVFGLVLLIFPGPGALALTLWIGAFASIVGVFRILFALRLRRWVRRQQGDPQPGRA